MEFYKTRWPLQRRRVLTGLRRKAKIHPSISSNSIRYGRIFNNRTEQRFARNRNDLRNRLFFGSRGGVGHQPLPAWCGCLAGAAGAEWLGSPAAVAGPRARLNLLIIK